MLAASTNIDAQNPKTIDTDRKGKILKNLFIITLCCCCAMNSLPATEYSLLSVDTTKWIRSRLYAKQQAENDKAKEYKVFRAILTIMSQIIKLPARCQVMLAPATVIKPFLEYGYITNQARYAGVKTIRWSWFRLWWPATSQLQQLSATTKSLDDCQNQCQREGIQNQTG